MGRSTEPEGVEQEAESLLRCGRVDAQQIEDLLLDVAPMDPDAARAQLPAVEHQVVRLRSDAQQHVGVESPAGGHACRGRRDDIEIVGVGHRERVMCGYRKTVGVYILEQREVDDPQEVQPALVHRRTA